MIQVLNARMHMESSCSFGGLVHSLKLLTAQPTNSSLFLREPGSSSLNRLMQRLSITPLFSCMRQCKMPLSACPRLFPFVLTGSSSPRSFNSSSRFSFSLEMCFSSDLGGFDLCKQSRITTPNKTAAIV